MNRNYLHTHITKAGIDYYPFGMLMPERSYSSSAYKYGFNGKEKDDENNVEGGSYDFGARIYDSRLARWLSLDPEQRNYVSLNPYNFTANSPIIYVDIEGKSIGLGSVPNLNASHPEGLRAIQNSKVITDYLSQFVSTLNGNAIPYSGNTTAGRVNGRYANSVTLNFQNTPRPAGPAAALPGPDVTVGFLFNLAAGGTVNAAAYTPAMGAIASATVNVGIIGGVYSTGESLGNNQAYDAAYSSLALTEALFSSVSNFTAAIDANSNPTTGVVNWGGVANAYQAMVAAGTLNNPSPNAISAEQDLANSNPISSGSLQYDIVDRQTGSTVCSSSISLGNYINRIEQVPGRVNPSSSLSTNTRLLPITVNWNGGTSPGPNVRLSPTPDSNRVNNETTCGN